VYYVHAIYANVVQMAQLWQWDCGILRERGRRMWEFLDLGVDPSIGNSREKWVLVTK